MEFPNGIRLGAIVPGCCAVPGCDNPEVLPANGLCLVHNALLADFTDWLENSLAFDSWTLWRWWVCPDS